MSCSHHDTRPRALLAGFLVVLSTACSAKAPPSGESRPASPEVRPEAPQAGATPAPDPREAVLSATVLQLLENEHLLRKPIDDELSRTAFATYLDAIDASKMFLLKKDRDALAKYADKIDDELRSGSLELAHEGSRIFVERVAVVEKLVAELLAAPFDHSDEEWIELDPKKVEVAATEQELRERWRRRLELEVIERVAQMEARLEAAAKRDQAAKDAAKGAKDAKDAKAKPVASIGRRPRGKVIGGSPSEPKLDGSNGAAALAPDSGPSDRMPAHPSDDDDDEDKVSEARTPLASIPTTPEGRDAKARAELAKSYAASFVRRRHPGVLDAASDLINAVTSTLDPHTTYLPPAEKANFDIRMSGSLEGIGALLREKDDYVEVVEIVPGGASWRQGGLSPGDLILSVAADGKEPVDTMDMRIDDVVKMIRGPKGSIVHLRIQKPTGDQQSVSIKRDVIVVEETYARAAILSRKGTPGYGYIHLPSFYGGRGPGQRTAAGDVHRLLGELKRAKVAGVILDIRRNGGGLLGDAIEMAGSFIDKGPVVQVQDNHGRRDTLSDDDPGTDYDGPVIVLVDRFSASASEIVAGALQDYKRAIIVGTGPTHGKGTVQTLADLDRVTRGKIELGSLKITIQQFFRVSGSSTQREGVMPDIVLPDPAGHIESGERELEHAIPWSQIPPAQHADWAPTWKTPALVERSAARVAKQPVLAKIASLTQILRASRNDTRLPLSRAAWDAHRKQQRAAIEAASPEIKDGPSLLGVKSLEDPAPRAPAPTPGPGVNPDDRSSRWREIVARDPWVDECVNILADMAK